MLGHTKGLDDDAIVRKLINDLDILSNVMATRMSVAARP